MAPTFGANREKLAAYGLQDQVEEINLKLVALSKEAAEPFHALVGGDVSPAGVMIEPYGDLTFDELYDIYLEQIRALKKAGVDFIALETGESGGSSGRSFGGKGGGASGIPRLLR